MKKSLKKGRKSKWKMQNVTWKKPQASQPHRDLNKPSRRQSKRFFQQLPGLNGRRHKLVKGWRLKKTKHIFLCTDSGDSVIVRLYVQKMFSFSTVHTEWESFKVCSHIKRRSEASPEMNILFQRPDQCAENIHFWWVLSMFKFLETLNLFFFLIRKPSWSKLQENKILKYFTLFLMILYKRTI